MKETLRATDAGVDIVGERVSNVRLSDAIDLTGATPEHLQELT